MRDSCGSPAFSNICNSVYVFVCQHDKTKTAETKITKPINMRSRAQGHKV